MLTTRLAGRVLAPGVLALALTGLTACGDDTDASSGAPGGSSADLEVLTEDQAQQALLSEAQMGEGFTSAEPAEDDTAQPDMGCLSALDDMDDIGAESEAKIEYTSTSDSGLPSLENDVFSYPDTERISDRIAEVSSALEGCDAVEFTDDDGTSFSLDVSVDTDTTAEDVDEQVTLEATGTVASGKQRFPIGIHLSSVRIDNHVTVVIYTDMPQDQAESSAQFDGYVTAAAARLAAVAAGETPSDELLA